MKANPGQPARTTPRWDWLTTARAGQWNVHLIVRVAGMRAPRCPGSPCDVVAHTLA